MIEMESLVRQLMIEQTDGLALGPRTANRVLAAARRRRRKRERLVLFAVSSAVVALAAASIATATGVMPWIRGEQQFLSTPFVTTPNPATVPGSKVVLTVPGPESTTFEVITNNTVTIGGELNSCTAVINKDAQGRFQPIGTGCAGPNAVTAKDVSESSDWPAPSGAKYAVVDGPEPTSEAATVAITDRDGVTIATGHVGGGYFLVYTPATEALPSTGSLVFFDTAGEVVDKWSLDLSPLRPCTSASSPAPCG
jgi:hypothetical protein